MTAQLKKAFELAAQLPEEEQDLLADWLFCELETEDAFDRKIAATAHKLKPLAEAAMKEHRAGKTQPLTPDAL